MDNGAAVAALLQSGVQARARCDLPVAQADYEQAVALLRDSGDRLYFAHTIRPYAPLLNATGRRDEARALFEEAALLYVVEGIEAGVTECRHWLSVNAT